MATEYAGEMFPAPDGLHGLRFVAPGPKGDGQMWFTAISGGVGTVDTTAVAPSLNKLPGIPKEGSGSIGFSGIAASSHHIWCAQPYGATPGNGLTISGLKPDGTDLGNDKEVPYDHAIDRWDDWGRPPRWLWAMVYANNGYVYFTQKFSGRIGRFKPGPSMKTPSEDYKLVEWKQNWTGHRENSVMEDMVQGADDNLYWVDSGNQVIGVTTLQGLDAGHLFITDRPSGITAGPDGHVWFTASDGDYIGRFNINSQSVDHKVHLPPGSEPFGITTGLNNDIWFTATGTKQIGHMDFSPSKVNDGPWATHMIAIPTTLIDLPAGMGDERFAGIAVAPDGRVWYSSTYHWGYLAPVERI